MLVQQILKSKADQSVVTVTAGSLVSDAVDILAQKRIGTVVVAEGDKVLGILSERDIVRELSARGSVCLQAAVSEHMTGNPVCAALTDDADKVLATMTEGRFRHMPVTENDRLVGIVTLGDVVKAKLTELSMEKDALQGMIMGH